MPLSQLWRAMGLERLRAAKALLGAGLFRDSISRSYYSAYCAATSRLANQSVYFARGRNNPSHEQLPDLIQNAGTLPLAVRRHINRSLRRLRRAREDADYRPGVTVDRTLALLCIHDATDILRLLEISDE